MFIMNSIFILPNKIKFYEEVENSTLSFKFENEYV
jgi:hypothetical protein